MREFRSKCVTLMIFTVGILFVNSTVTFAAESVKVTNPSEQPMWDHAVELSEKRVVVVAETGVDVEVSDAKPYKMHLKKGTEVECTGAEMSTDVDKDGKPTKESSCIVEVKLSGGRSGHITLDHRNPRDLAVVR